MLFPLFCKGRGEQIFKPFLERCSFRFFLSVCYLFEGVGKWKRNWGRPAQMAKPALARISLAKSLARIRTRDVPNRERSLLRKTRTRARIVMPHPQRGIQKKREKSTVSGLSCLRERKDIPFSPLFHRRHIRFPPFLLLNRGGEKLFPERKTRRKGGWRQSSSDRLHTWGKKQKKGKEERKSPQKIEDIFQKRVAGGESRSFALPPFPV